MLNDQLSAVLRRWASRVNATGGDNPRFRIRPTLRLEQFEAREVPAVLPAPSVDDGSQQKVINSTFPAPYNTVGGFDNVLQQPTASNSTVGITTVTSTMALEYDPQVVASPTDPSRLVMFSTGASADGGSMNVFGRYSLNGGEDWIPFFDARDGTNTVAGTITPFQNRFDDLSIDPGPNFAGNNGRTAFANASQPSVAFGRDGFVYLTMIQHNNAKTSGAVVLFRIDFRGNVPTIVSLGGNSQDTSAANNSGTGTNNTLPAFSTAVNGKLMFRWTGQDPAFNPVVAVENGLSSSTDPETGRVQFSTTAAAGTPMANAVFVAWNTAAAAANTGRYSGGTYSTYTPNIILVAHSFDNGTTFTEPVPAQNDAYGAGAGGGTNPQILFSPNSSDRAGDSFTQAGAGRMIVAWAGNDGAVRTDTSRPDGGQQGAEVAASGWKRSALGSTATTLIPEAISATPFDIPRSGEQSLTLATTDFSTNFDVVTDFNVRVSIRYHQASDLAVTLIPPAALRAAGYQPVRLAISGMQGSDVGYVVYPDTANGYRHREVGAWFDEQAPRRPDDGNNAASTPAGQLGVMLNRYQSASTQTAFPAPRGSQTVGLLADGQFDNASGFYTFSTLGLLQYEGLTPAQLAGDWTLRVTDYVTNTAPTGYGGSFISNFGLKFTGRVRNGLDTTNVPYQNSVEQSSADLTTGTKAPFIRLQQSGADQQSLASLDPNAAAANQTSSTAANGVGAGLRVAYDATQGSYSPYRGRLYAVYTAVTPGGITNGNVANTDIYLQYSDDNGVTWSDQIRVNKDVIQDNTTQGSRAQFSPQIAVDQVTGTVVVSWYDASQDASNGRVNVYVATSIDGGKTWSDPTFVNAAKTAVDALNLQRTTLEGVPTNIQNLGNAGGSGSGNGLGLSQSLLAYGGKVKPYFSGNLNTTGVKVYTADVRTAAGPRIVESDTGPVTEAARFLSGTVAGVPIYADIPNADGSRSGRVEYNNTFDGEGVPDDPTVANGTRRMDGFIVRFDRGVEPLTVNAAGAITVTYTSPQGVVSAVAVQSVRPLDTLDYPEDSVYFVRFVTPQTRTGSYSYSVAPTVRDRLRNPYELAAFQLTGTSETGLTRPNVPLVTPLPASETGLTTNRFTQVANLTIPNATGGGDGVVSSVLTVASGVNDANFDLQAVVVDLNIDHPNTQDLIVELVSPDGVRVKLIEARGGTGDNFTNTRLDSNAEIEIADSSRALAPFTGAFRPEKLPLPTAPSYPLTDAAFTLPTPSTPTGGRPGNTTGRYALDAFVGGTINGNWTLIVTDQGTGTQAPATLRNFSLTFTAGRRNTPTDQALGNFIDQDADGRSMEVAEVTTVQGGTLLNPSYPYTTKNDVYTIPGASKNIPNRTPLNPNSLPLTLAGPRIVSTSAEGQAATIQRVVVNSTLSNSVKVTFQAAQTYTELLNYVQRGMVWITGPIAGQFGVVPVNADGQATAVVGQQVQVTGLYTVDVTGALTGGGTSATSFDFVLTTSNNLTPGESYSVVFGPGPVTTFTSVVSSATTLTITSSQPMRATDLQAAVGAGFLRITRRAPNDTRLGVTGTEEGIPIHAISVVAADGTDNLTTSFVVTVDTSAISNASSGQAGTGNFNNTAGSPRPAALGGAVSNTWWFNSLDPAGTYDVRIATNPAEIGVQNEFVRLDRSNNPVIAITLVSPQTLDLTTRVSNSVDRNPVSPRLIQDALNTGRIIVTDSVTGQTFRPSRVEAVDDTGNTVVAPTVTSTYWFGFDGVSNVSLISGRQYFVTIQPLPPFGDLANGINGVTTASVNPLLKDAAGRLNTIDLIAPTLIDPASLTAGSIVVDPVYSAANYPVVAVQGVDAEGNPTTLPTRYIRLVVDASGAAGPLLRNQRFDINLGLPQIDPPLETVVTAPNALNVTFDREVKPESVIRYARTGAADFLTLAGAPVGYRDVVGVDALGNVTTAPTRFFRITTLTPPLPSPTVYTVNPGPFVQTENIFLNAGAGSVIVEFDRDMNAASFTNADIVRVVGPTPDVVINSTDLTVEPVLEPVLVNGQIVYQTTAGNSRWFRVRFPVAGANNAVRLNGPYTIEIGSDISSTATQDYDGDGTYEPLTEQEQMDPNANAAVDVVRGGADAGQPILSPATGIELDPATGLPRVGATDPLAYSTVYDTVTGRLANPALPARAGGGEISDRRNGPRTALGTTSDPAVQSVTIPSRGTANLSVDIPDEFLLRQDLGRFSGTRLTITPDITFPNLPDLVGTLIAPDGTRITLFTNLGQSGSGQVRFTPTFDDGAASPLGTISGDVTGVANPQLPLSALLGKSSLGRWTLEVRNVGASSGTINGFTLRLTRAKINDGLGEPIADRSQFGFRVFVQDPTNSNVTTQWTPVGPTPGTSVDNGAGGGTGVGTGAQQASNAGRVSAVTVDPADASGNTVFAAGGSGGLWKTTNFLTLDPAGPLWVPLTDFGPTAALTVTSIAVIPRGTDPTQSIVLATTGGGAQASADPQSPARQGQRSGIGLIISENGGQTFRIADSTRNAFGPTGQNDNGLPDPRNAANWLAIDDRNSSGGGDLNFRNGLFLGLNGTKVTFDPRVNVSGGYYIYAAFADTVQPSGNIKTGGVYRSSDTGRTWQLLRAGNATDVVLAAGSADSTGQLQTLYAAYGSNVTTGAPGAVFSTSQATSTSGGLVQLNGGGSLAFIGDAQNNPNPNPPTLAPVTAAPAAAGGAGQTTPTGQFVRLAAPALANSPLLNGFYRGWLYAVVSSGTVGGASFNGLWLTKDGGNTWTRIRLPRAGAQAFSANSLTQTAGVNPQGPTGGYGTNDDAAAYDEEINGWLSDPAAINVTVDPTNPNVVYLTGNYVIRVDATLANTPQSLIAFDNSDVGQGGTLQNATTGGVNLRAGTAEPGLRRQGSVTVYTDPDNTPTSFFNLQRDPNSPFLSGTTLQVNNVQSFTNDGDGAKFSAYLTEALAGSLYVYGVTALVDPLTGKTRLIFGTQQGVFTGVDAGDGTLLDGLGFADSVRFARNGNLQISQLYSGAVQPSQLAADVAGAMFYAVSEANGFPVTGSNTLQTGNTTGATRDGDRIGSDINPAQYASGMGVAGGFPNRGTMAYGSGTGVATDPSGSGTAYQYRLPEEFDGGSGFTRGDFFRVFQPGQPPAGTGTSRTTGLNGTDPNEWNNNTIATGTFAANPFDPNALAIASSPGRLYRTVDRGLTWSVIGQPADFNNNPIRAIAFGAPDFVGTGTTDFSNLLYVGTQAGDVYVTANGTGPYTRIFSATTFGDFSPVVRISANTKLATKDIVIVTQQGVYFLSGANGAGKVSRITAAQITNNTIGTAWGTAFNAGSANLFSINEPIFGESRLAGANSFYSLRAGSLAALAVDWRYAISGTTGGYVDANDDGYPEANSFPVVYVGGDGGVFRSANLFQGTGSTWTAFPNAQPVTNVNGDGAAQDGGYLPNTIVTDLDLAVGDFRYVPGDPGTVADDKYVTDYANGYNQLVATTYGRGQWTIRLNPNFLQPFTDPDEFQTGPFITAADNSSRTGQNSIRLTFAGPVDPVTFTTADIKLVDPNGVDVTAQVDRVVLVSPQSGVGTNPRNVYDVVLAGTYTPIPGAYRLIVGETTAARAGALANPTSELTDLAGNRMNQNRDLRNGDANLDAFETLVTFVGAAANPQTAANDPNADTFVTLRLGAPGATDTSANPVVFDAAGNKLTYGNTVLVAGVKTQLTVTANKFATFLGAATEGGNIGATVVDAGFTGTVDLRDITNGASTFSIDRNQDGDTLDAGETGDVAVYYIDLNNDTDFDDAGETGALSTLNELTFAAADQGVKRLFVEFRRSGTGLVLEGAPTGGQNLAVAGRAVFTVIGNVGDSFEVTGYASPAKAGVAQTMTVVAKDQFGNVASGYKGSVSFDSDNPLESFDLDAATAGLQTTYTFTADVRPDTYDTRPAAVRDNGSKTFTNVATLSKASLQRNTANDGTVADPFRQDFTAQQLFTVTVAGIDTVNAPSTQNAATIVGKQKDIEIQADVATRLVLSGLPAQVAAGEENLFYANAFDQFGNDALGLFAGTAFTSTVAPDVVDLAGEVPPAVTDADPTVPVVQAGTAGNQATYAFAAGDKGQRIFSATLYKAAPGVGRTLTAGITAGPSVTVVPQTGIEVLANRPTSIEVTPPTQSVTAGVAGSVTVTIYDEFGNVADGRLGTIRGDNTFFYTGKVLLDTNHPEGNASFRFNGGTTDDSFVTFTAGDAGRKVVPFTFTQSKFRANVADPISATNSWTVTGQDDPNNASPLSGASQVGFGTSDSSFVEVNPAAASQLVVTTPFSPDPIAAGDVGTFVLTAFDPFGNVANGGVNPANSYQGSVVLASNTTTLGGSVTFGTPGNVPGPTAFVAADRGVKTFAASFTKANTPATLYDITASAAGLTSGTTGAVIDVLATDAASMKVTGYNLFQEAGVSDDVTVTLYDRFDNVANNPARGYAGTVTVSGSQAPAAAVTFLHDGDNLPSYTFPGDGTATAIFRGAFTKAGANRAVTANSPQLPLGARDAAQSGISVYASTLDKFSVVGFPTPVVAGTKGTFSVVAQDRFGNTLDGQFDNKAPGTAGDTLFTGRVNLSTTDAQGTFLPTPNPVGGFVNGVSSYQATLRTAKSAAQGGQTITATVDPTSITAGSPTATGSQTGIVVVADKLNRFDITPFYTISGGNKTMVPVVVAGRNDPNDAAADFGYRFQVSGADQFGNPVTTYTGSVRISSTDPQAAFLPSTYTFTTADQGVREFRATLKTAGSQSISVQDGSNGTLNGRQTAYYVVADKASKFRVSGYPSSSPAMTPQSFTVTALDAYGNVADGAEGPGGQAGGDSFQNDYTGTVRFTSSDPAAMLPANTAFAAGDKGTRNFTAALNTVGVQSITATDTVTPTVTGSQTGIVVSSGEAKGLVLTPTFTGPAVAGVPAQFLVRVVDEAGNTALNYTRTVDFSSSDSKAAVSPDPYQFTAADSGQRFVTVTFQQAGQQTISGVDLADASIDGTSGFVTVVGAGAVRFDVSGYPTSTVAGVSNAFSVVARDAFGNVASGYTGTVTFRSSDAQAVLPANTAFTAADGGVKVFSAALATAGVQSITAADAANGAILGSQGNITVSPAAATRFDLAGYPDPTQAGLAQTFTVTATDAFGNLATNFTGTVSFRSTDPQATLPVDYAFRPEDAGVRTFSATLRTAGEQSLSVFNIADPAGADTQSAITVAPGEAVGYTVVVQPGTAGQPTLVTVTVRDAFGNVATGYRGTVAFGSSDRAAGLPAATTFRAEDQGVKTFAVTFQTAGNQSVTVVDTANPALVATGGTPSPVAPAGAVRFAVTGFPDDAPAGTSGTVTVTAFDAFGNVATTYGGTVRFSSSDPRAVLPNAQTLTNGTGTFTVVLVSQGTQTLTVSDAADGGVNGSQTVFLRGSTASEPPIFTVSSGPGASNVVQVRDADGNVIATYQPFEPSFTGGTTSAILNSPEGTKLVAAAGPGRAPDVRIFDLATGASTSFLPFETSFQGGVNLSVGDINGDGTDDIIVSPDQGGGPRVQIRDGRTGEKLADFFAFTDDPGFRGGARTAVGDVNGDGKLDLIVAAGFGGGPRVAIFDGQRILSGAPTRLISDFFAFEPGLRNGVYVAAGDVNGDGKADLMLGAGPGGGPRVRIVNGGGLMTTPIPDGLLDRQPSLTVGNFFAGDSGNRGGVRVTSTNLNNDSRADLVVGSGEGAGSRITGYTADALLSANPAPDFDLDAFPGFDGGVYVG